MAALVAGQVPMGAVFGSTGGLFAPALADEIRPPHPLALPAPGRSIPGALSEQAEKWKGKAFEYVAADKWDLALLTMGFALEAAHCAPQMMFNLALAYDRSGQPIPAAMWYRAYLAAEPSAANAGAVRAQMEKLVADVDRRVIQLFVEAERIADTLSAGNLTPGGVSPRLAALNELIFRALSAGRDELAASLARKARALSMETGQPFREPIDTAFETAVYARDVARAEKLMRPPGAIWMAYMHLVRGDAAQAKQWLDFDPLLTPRIEELEETHLYEAAEIVWRRAFGALRQFDEQIFADAVWHAELAFWNGQTEVAMRIAQTARRYYENYAGDATWSGGSFMVLLALLGDDAEFRRRMRHVLFVPAPIDRPFRYGDLVAPGARIALLIAARFPGREGAALIEELRRRRIEGVAGHAIGSEVFMPLSDFALEAARGNTAGALRALISGRSQSKLNFEGELASALRFAVKTGQADLAMDIANEREDTFDAFAQVHRLLFMRRIPDKARQRAEEYMRRACGGWRPGDTEQAWRVWRAIRLARSYRLNREHYGILPHDIERITATTPERTPLALAEHAARLQQAIWAARAAP